MFVVNFKLDMKKLLIVCVVIAIAIATIVELTSNPTASVNSKAEKMDKYDFVLTEENFTSSLKQIHENIDENIGKTIKLSGFVFKMPDFKDNYFVCGRNTLDKGNDAVAGFMCQSNDSKLLMDNEWLEVTGIIIKGEYNGQMPVIQIGSMKKITAPANSFVKNIQDEAPKQD